jgi:hypothetical protein
VEEEEPKRVSLLRVSTKRLQQEENKLALKALERLRRDTDRRLPENQAVVKEEEREEEEAAVEEDVAEALSPPRWTNLSMPLPLLYVCVC